MADDVLVQAAGHVTRLRASPGDEALEDEIAAWMLVAPAHASAFALAERAWLLAGERRPVLPAAGGVPRRAPGRRILGAALAMAAALVLILASPELFLRLRPDHVAGTRSEQVRLPDGSELFLAAGSAARLDFGEGKRDVTLLRGQAFLNVAREARPFRVQAGALRVTVMGTAFEVSLSGEGYGVAVASGRVQVELPPDPRAEDLLPGEILTIGRDGTGRRREAVGAEEVATWRRGRLLVRDTPLAEVAARIGASLPGPVLVRGEALRAQRVTGFYDLTEPDAALRALMAPFGGEVTRLGPFVTILSEP